MVDAHGGERFGVAFGWEGGGEDGEDGLGEIVGKAFEAEAEGAQEEFWVGPAAPFFRGEGVAQLGGLGGGEEGEGCVYGGGDLCGVDAQVFVFVEVWADGSVVGYAFVGLFEEFFPGFGQVVEPWWVVGFLEGF